MVLDQVCDTAKELLSRRRGENAVDELLRLYDAIPEVPVKKYVVAGLGQRKDPRALNKLIEIARTAPDVQLRALYELAKWGPTTANSQPQRVVFVRSAEAKDRLAPALSSQNRKKALAAARPDLTIVWNGGTIAPKKK